MIVRQPLKYVSPLRLSCLTVVCTACDDAECQREPADHELQIPASYVCPECGAAARAEAFDSDGETWIRARMNG